MNSVDDPLAWVAYAEEDLLAARSALRHKKPLIITACFHAQQCAEKYLKALLVLKRAEFPKTHDLSALNTLCVTAGIMTGLPPAILATLSEYAVHARYPGEEPSLEEARHALDIAKTVRRMARSLLGLK